MGPSDDPRSSGLWFTVSLDSGDFVGREAVGLAAIDPDLDVTTGDREIECGSMGRFPVTVSRRARSTTHKVHACGGKSTYL